MKKTPKTSVQDVCESQHYMFGKNKLNLDHESGSGMNPQ